MSLQARNGTRLPCRDPRSPLCLSAPISLCRYSDNNLLDWATDLRCLETVNKAKLLQNNSNVNRSLSQSIDKEGQCYGPVDSTGKSKEIKMSTPMSSRWERWTGCASNWVSSAEAAKSINAGVLLRFLGGCEWSGACRKPRIQKIQASPPLVRLWPSKPTAQDLPPPPVAL